MTPAPVSAPPVPPYAAGAGIPTTALEAACAAGWERYLDDAGNVTYTSPDGRCSVEFGPETDRYLNDYNRLWIAEYRPGPGQLRAWAAHFGDHTPAEAIGAFITALTDCDGIRGSHPGYGAGAGEDGAETVFAAAEAEGWVRAVRTLQFDGGHGKLHLSYSAAPPEIPGQFLAIGPHWHLTIPESANGWEWTAIFTAQVPGEAISAFLTALTDSARRDPGPRHVAEAKA